MYKEIKYLLKQNGFDDDISFVTESVSDKIQYISIYYPSILLYSKVESIKKILHSYNVNVYSNVNIECVIIKLIE